MAKIDLYNQTKQSENKIILDFEKNKNKDGFFGKNKVAYCTLDGKMYRAISDSVPANTNPATDNTNWVEVSPVGELWEYVESLGTINNGIMIEPNGDNLKLNLVGGTLTRIDNINNLIKSTTISDTTEVSFTIYDQSGNIVQDNVTELDPAQYDKDGTLTDLSQDNDAQFITFYIDWDGKLYGLLGQKQYPTLNNAKDNYGFENKIIPTILDGMQPIGGILVRKDTKELTGTTRATFIRFSKIGESAIGGSTAIDTALLKEPVEDLASLQAVKAPLDGEIRQVLSTLPDVTYYAFNYASTEGVAADDGTIGYWNELSGGKVKFENINADTTAEYGKMYYVDTTNTEINVTLPAPKEGKIIIIKNKTEFNAVKVSSSDLIDGENNSYIYESGSSVVYYSTDSTWLVRSSHKYVEEIAKNKAFLGQISIMYPRPENGIYELNGQTIGDEELANFISARQAEDSDAYPGFTVNGNQITLPDWSKYGGEVMYTGGESSDARGLEYTKIGKFVEQSIQRHTHTYFKMPGSHRWNDERHTYGDYVNGYGSNAQTGQSGGDYTRSKGRVVGRWCIIGTQYFKLSADAEIAKEANVTFTGLTVDGGLSTKTIFEGVTSYVSTVDLAQGKVLDTANCSGCTVVDEAKGLITYQRANGGGDFTITLADRDRPKRYMRQYTTDKKYVDTTYKVMKEWDVFPKLAGDVIEVSWDIPVRNDHGTDWGGVYHGMDYSIDGGANWYPFYDSGYCTATMSRQADSIDRNSGSLIVDIPEVNDATSVKIRFKARTYNHAYGNAWNNQGGMAAGQYGAYHGGSASICFKVVS